MPLPLSSVFSDRSGSYLSALLMVLGLVVFLGSARGQTRPTAIAAGVTTGISADVAVDPVQCGYPGKPLNSKISTVRESYKAGDTITYECELGHRIRGQEKRTCLSNGTWNGTLPICMDALKVNDDQVTGSLGTDSSTIHLFDRNSETCVSTSRNKTLTWKIKLDRPYHIVAITLVPQKPADGSKIALKITAYAPSKRPWAIVDTYNFQDAPLGFTYRIKDGELVSRDTVEVEDRVMTRTTFAMCEILLWAIDEVEGCGEPEVPLHGKIVYSHDKKTVFYQCDSGYELVGNVTRLCQWNRVWSGKEPKCTEYMRNTPDIDTSLPKAGAALCGEPAVSRHSKVAFSKDKRTVFYSCDPGYEPVGEQVRDCQDNGEWSGREILCIRNRTTNSVLLRPQTAALKGKNEDRDSSSGESFWKGAAIIGITAFILTLAVFVGVSVMKRNIMPVTDTQHSDKVLS